MIRGPAAAQSYRRISAVRLDSGFAVADVALCGITTLEADIRRGCKAMGWERADKGMQERRSKGR